MRMATLHATLRISGVVRMPPDMLRHLHGIYLHFTGRARCDPGGPFLIRMQPLQHHGVARGLSVRLRPYLSCARVRGACPQPTAQTAQEGAAWCCCALHHLSGAPNRPAALCKYSCRAREGCPSDMAAFAAWQEGKEHSTMPCQRPTSILAQCLPADIHAVAASTQVPT